MIKLASKVSNNSKSAFTLIELLVVIAVIALLMGILIPSLAVAKERARRLVCSKNVNQVIVGIISYADENDEDLPTGKSEMGGTDEHTPVLTTETRNAMVEILGDQKALMCPWLGKPFDSDDGYYYPGYGYVIGYNYLGGHLGTPWPLSGPATEEWESPQSNMDDPRMPVITELNAWTTSSDQIFSPHGVRGPINQFCEGGGDDQTPVDIGAAGGNIGYLDASVTWKKIEDMKVYRSSRQYTTDGCFSYW